jgi:hypothetical protein
MLKIFFLTIFAVKFTILKLNKIKFVLFRFAASGGTQPSAFV